MAIQFISTFFSQFSSLSAASFSNLRLHQHLWVSGSVYLFLKASREKVGDLSVVSVRIEIAQQGSVRQVICSFALQIQVSSSIKGATTVKSVASIYFRNAPILSSAQSRQFSNWGYRIFRSLSHPNKATPIACISIVVDCIRVEPANAISPTLQFILFIFQLNMNYFDLYTFAIRISSVFPQRIQGLRWESSVDFQTAPITQGVSPPSVLPMRISFYLKPSSTSCCWANSGWSSKSQIDLMSAASPPAMNAITFSLHSLCNSQVSCLQRVSRTKDSRPVAPHPQIKTRPPLSKHQFTSLYIFYSWGILPCRIFMVLISNCLMRLIAVGRSFLARSDMPIVRGFCFSVNRQPNLNWGAIFRKSSAVSFSDVINILIIYRLVELYNPNIFWQ